MRPIPLAPNQVRRFCRGGAAIAKLRGIAHDQDDAPEDWIGSTLVPHGTGPVRLSGPLDAIRCLPPAHTATATDSRPLDPGS